MKDKNFWVGVVIAVLLVALYKCTPSFTKPKEETQSNEASLTLFDLNFTPVDSPKAVPDHAFIAYKQTGEGAFEEKQVKLEDFKGKPVILHFWATWCKPCISELPKYDAVAANKDIYHITIISENQPPQAIADFYKQYSIKNLSIYVDAKGILSRSLQVSGLPTTVFLSADGKEIGRIVGPVEWDNPKAVNLLLAKMR